MTFDFINPLMLFGLAGLSLPILAHLLSRRKYDVVEWGAMQFLELGWKTRRKLRLEQLLLLLLRMVLIALVVLALSRPWGQGRFLTNLVSAQSRDVVFVIDGSYSMGWEGKAVTPYAAAIQWAHEFLEDLRPGDTVSLIDARDQPWLVIESPTRDFDLVREQLSELPEPTGSSNLVEAVARAVRILSGTDNLARECIVLTDGQARGWSTDDANRWTRLDELLAQPKVKPRIWVVNTAGEMPAARTNFAVDRLTLSRELTAVGFPVRLTSKVRYWGGEANVRRRVYLEVDGQRLGERTVQVQLEPGGEASVEFEHRFSSPGSHLLSVVLDDDNLPGDNRARAAVTVSKAIPVALVDGNPQLDPTKSETFFAKAALTASANESPLVRASVVPWDRFGLEQMQEADVVVLANVPRLSLRQIELLAEYVAGGGGLIVAAGDRVDRRAYNELLFDGGKGLLPAALEKIETDTAEGLRGVHVVNSSLDLPWLQALRTENDGDFVEARFQKWWKVTLPGPPGGNSGGKDADASASSKSGVTRRSAAMTAIRLTSSDPLLVTCTYGTGGVALLTVPLDADWSTLPLKRNSYVPFLHELILFLVSKVWSRA